MTFMRPIALLLTFITASLALAEEPMPVALIEQIREASLDYHQKLRNYDLRVTEILHAQKRDVHQKSVKRIVEDSLGQSRFESDIEQYDKEGNVIASAQMLHIYNLREEVASQVIGGGEDPTERSVTIRDDNTMAKVVQPKTFFTAGGQPFYQLIDNLRVRNVAILGGIVDYPDYPETLVELVYEEVAADGVVMRHSYLINLTGNFFPMRQETYYNGKRYLVLIPTPKELAPGIFFPVQGSKISYDIENEDNAVSSVTNMVVDKVELNTNILPGTFTFVYEDGDAITDYRSDPPTTRRYVPIAPDPAPKA